MVFKLQIGVRTDIGTLRAKNEDSYLILDDAYEGYDPLLFGYLMMVADGMGGHAAGEVASRMACETMRSYYLSESEGDTPSPLTPESALRMLSDAILTANRHIYRFSRQDNTCRGMGTTLSALLILGDTALIGHVGDSRIYRFRNGRLEPMTTDHTEVQSMVDKGYLTPAEAASHPLRHLLLEALGVSETLEEIFTRMEKVNPGDIYLLSSDGLHDMISDAEIGLLLSKSRNAKSASRRLIRQALDAGGRDNVTAVVVRILTEQS